MVTGSDIAVNVGPMFGYELSDGAQVTAGTYAVASGHITLNRTKSSCGGTRVSADVAYDFSGKNLRLSDPSGVLVMERVTTTDDGSGASVAYGCFADDGTFTTGSVVDL